MREKYITSKLKKTKYNDLGYDQNLSTKLCIELEQKFEEFKIDQDKTIKLKKYLNLLATKDIKSSEHSIRVALLSQYIGKQISIDSKALLYSGLIHDVGKVLVPSTVLQKTENFRDRDMQIIRKHPLNTFRLVSGVFDFSAQVALRHHKHQVNAYPDVLPLSKIPYSNETMNKIDFYSKIISIADFFDAVISRKNDKFSNQEKLSLDNIIDIMIKNYPEMKDIIIKLRKSDVFDNHMKLIEKMTNEKYLSYIYDGLGLEYFI